MRIHQLADWVSLGGEFSYDLAVVLEEVLDEELVEFGGRACAVFIHLSR